MSYVMCYAMQLNPGGCLNWKYYGETFVRSSGMPYCVVRACGLVTEDLDKYFNMVVSKSTPSDHEFAPSDHESTPLDHESTPFDHKSTPSTMNPPLRPYSAPV